MRRFLKLMTTKKSFISDVREEKSVFINIFFTVFADNPDFPGLYYIIGLCAVVSVAQLTSQSWVHLSK